ncbi:receptor-like protein kinase HSL1 [Alnus glutinosa]|uniref:receptor-like protein kinase HSL1 n=1 Tax=Alnus glutinosa TaxID=3517 RepID=UPI002D7761FE|nr:receptor-like protein kinase HSL1 [Alnus glutinosa]
MSKLPVSFLRTPFLLLLLILIPTPLQVNSRSDNTERATLLNLKRQWGNPPSIQSWNSSSSPCDWPEIECANGTVTGIILRDKNITHKIPATICDLRNLNILDLSYNYIPGEFPRVLYNCSKLQLLDLSQNYFVGPIPDDIDRIPTLQYIDLGANNFSGDIPEAIGRLPELHTLNLYQNEFNGTFPRDIGNLSNLEVLRMAYNDKFVPAPIPPEFGRLRKLRFMWMTVTNLIGEIPENISGLPSLEHLDLARNNLVGAIPSGLFLLKNLSYVYLFHNRLAGEIPSLVESTNLIGVDLSMNNLTGSIPEDFGKLKYLKLLSLFTNQLTGEIPKSLGLLPLIDFRVFSNKLTGTLPAEMGLNSKLEAFEVSGNQLSGQLPQHLCDGGALQGLVAFSNNLSGELPKWVGNCTSLRTVQLHENNFSGELPFGLWTSLNLSSLMLTDNSFSGELPSKFARNLSRLEIGKNKFSGQIPVGVASWVNLVVYDASNNLLSGKIPVELTSLHRLNSLFLDGNQLSGELPSEIISWKSLTTLNLSRNKLSGKIPGVVGYLPDLLYLDLSENQLSGEIPPEIGNLRLTSLNLSYNQLSGKIPYQFENLAYENSFLNNSNLCADNPIPGVPSCYTTQLGSSNKLSSTYLAMILVLAVIVFLVTLSLVLYKLRGCRTKKHRRNLGTWKITSFRRLDFEKLNILSNLTENNLLGSGGSGKVYRIPTDRPGEFVAVKRIWSDKTLDHKLEKEFMAEVQVLGMIRHSNIVKLLCCFSCQDTKLLVYEYKENQSLDKWLHGKERRSTTGMNPVHLMVLDWPKRLQIAIGVAQGLYYMHNDCSPPIIHRDVKSSNILLDAEFKASIADFGLAKILDQHGKPQTMSAVAGSVGYIAPEYAYTAKVNEKIDVYSFGVVLLELATGRDAQSGDEHMSLAEWAWWHYKERKSIADALDNEIKKACYLEEMSSVFKLGLMCTGTSPSTRPSMEEVLQILCRCSTSRASEGKKMGSEFDVAPLLGSATYLSSYKQSRKVSEEDADSYV